MCHPQLVFIIKMSFNMQKSCWSFFKAYQQVLLNLFHVSPQRAFDLSMHLFAVLPVLYLPWPKVFDKFIKMSYSMPNFKMIKT